MSLFFFGRCSIQEIKSKFVYPLTSARVIYVINTSPDAKFQITTEILSDWLLIRLER